MFTCEIQPSVINSAERGAISRLEDKTFRNSLFKNEENHLRWFFFENFKTAKSSADIVEYMSLFTKKLHIGDIREKFQMQYELFSALILVIILNYILNKKD